MSLDISYSDKKLRNICEKESVAKRHLPLAVVRTLHRRIDDICAADDLFDLPVTLDFLSRIPPGSFSIALSEGYSALFCAVDQKMPTDVHGNVNWQMVRRIKLVEISRDA
ncbi:hypothetical protein TUM20249_42610 [Pseudomonas tohonis]|nr:hypothetical protein TUM20249_42610 [Pseudomonas tohonis]